MQSRARPEAMLETIMSRMHGVVPAMPPAAMDTAPAVSAKLAELASAAQHTLSASDVGRVMQWAGTELALRDQKVQVSLCTFWGSFVEVLVRSLQ